MKQSVEYTYDLNGNLTSDANKGYNDIQYNYLNLPKRVGSTTSQYISYIYDAFGTKLAKVGTDHILTTWYAGSFVYSGIYSSGSLKYIIHPEGLYLPGSNYQYFLKDHLGNTRLVVNTVGAGGTIVQQTDYYPFGMDIANYNGGLDNKYRYNGKEFQTDQINNRNLDWYDYGARFYDPTIGRWHSMDPLAENRIWCSPYQYAQNNPIMRVDPNGMEDGWVTGPDRNTFWDPNTNSLTDFATNYTDMGFVGYSYVGLTAAGTDSEGNSKYGDQYGKFHGSTPVNEVTVTAENPIANSVANIAFGDHGNWESGSYGPATTIPIPDRPDYVALSVSGTAIVGGGGGLDGLIGYVKGDGVFLNGSLRIGDGSDTSYGINFTWGYYKGADKPTAISTSGLNVYQNSGAGLVNITLQQSVSTSGIGKVWDYFSIGVAFGSKTFYGGSVGTSLTTNPFYIYKEN